MAEFRPLKLGDWEKQIDLKRLEACLCACIWRTERMSAVGKSNRWEVRRYQEKPEGKAEAWVAENMG